MNLKWPHISQFHLVHLPLTDETAEPEALCVRLTELVSVHLNPRPELSAHK